MDLSKISVVIIVKNGGATLKECLESLKSFGEIILLENESSDDTLEIAYEFQKSFANLRIERSKFLGFGPLKNLAISYAKNEWIFNVDADEVLETSSLKELSALSPQKESIVALPRKNLYKKEWIKACGWYPDFVLRIFNKNFTAFNDNAVHESLKLPQNAKIIKLKNGFRHYTHQSIYSLIQKAQLYSTLWAQQNLHKSSSMSKALIRSGWRFFRDYVLRFGWLYGYKGFIISFYDSLGVFFKYTKLYEFQRAKIDSCALFIFNSCQNPALILDRLQKLTLFPDEVLIIEEKKYENNVELIRKGSKQFPCKLRYVLKEHSVEDLKASKLTRCEYVIMIDDIDILDPDFIKKHLNFLEHKVILQEGCIILDKRIKNQ